MAGFREWWGGADNPARGLPQSTQVQIMDYMSAAFKGGQADKDMKRFSTTKLKTELAEREQGT